MAKRDNADAIECRIKIPLWYCRVYECHVSDPENHHWHALIAMEQDPAPLGAGSGTP